MASDGIGLAADWPLMAADWPLMASDGLGFPLSRGHVGAGSGIVTCYAKAGEMQKAKEWAAVAMPKPGPERMEWVERMVAAIDAKLGELDEIDEISGR